MKELYYNNEDNNRIVIEMAQKLYRNFLTQAEWPLSLTIVDSIISKDNFSNIFRTHAYLVCNLDFDNCDALNSMRL